MTFRAVKDGDLFFLDAFNNGKIMTEGMIRGYLAETFGIFGRPKKRRGMSDGGNRATSGKECGGAKDETEQRNGESDGECSAGQDLTERRKRRRRRGPSSIPKRSGG